MKWCFFDPAGKITRRIKWVQYVR